MSRITDEARCKAVIHSHLDWLLGNQRGAYHLQSASEDYAKGYRAAIQDARKVIEEAPYQQEFDQAKLLLEIEALKIQLATKDNP